ncbi:restriction endonuclease subunit S [Rhizobium leguminosarum]|uniref:Restriction endonuclease S subunit n=1 Tax=Rhizobium leguminosarum TaxID=384 RepID=A0A7W9ZNK9_RHILE|nr:restriction endonuclease S subunit [Rhizobium leguminosarum]
MAWTTVRLGDVISLNIEAVPVDPTLSYYMAGVYSFGRGLFTRSPLSGAETTYKHFHKLSEGMIVLSQLKAWEGAVAIVGKAHAGCFLSTQFPTFRCNQELVKAEFIGWFLRLPSVWEELRSRARGMGARRDTVSPADFLDLSIPLPSINEQQRIVQQLDAAQARAEEARSVQLEVSKDREALMFALLRGPENTPHPRVRFGRIASLKKPDILVEPDKEYLFAGVYSFGKGVFESYKKRGAEFSYKTLSKVNAGDFIYPKLMAWEGALGIVPKDCDGLHVSPEFPVFSINQDIIYAEVVDAYFRHSSTWPNLNISSKGTNVRRRRLHPVAIQEHLIPLPPKSTQDIIRELACSDFNKLQEESQKELEALIPAMLHEIFERQTSTPHTTPETSSATVVQRPVEREAVVDTPFKEAVLVGAIVRAFHEDNGQPIGNFRLQKAVYFARRQMGERALDKEYLRKAAGPYNPTMRYSGGIKIATDKNWIKRATGRFGEGNTLDNQANEMDEWIERYQFKATVAWVRDRFKYKSNDIWEILATVDYAMLALGHEGTRPTPSAILSYIQSDGEWGPKIAKLHLTEASIQNAMVELESLFVTTR